MDGARLNSHTNEGHMNFSHRKASPARTAMLDKLHNGEIDAKALAAALLNYMSEPDVADFAESEGYTEPEDEDDDDDEPELDDDIEHEDPDGYRSGDIGDES